jgi:hypothetical protein
MALHQPKNPTRSNIMQLNKSQIAKLTHSEYLTLRSGLTNMTEIYMVDRTWHNANPQHRKIEESEARAREIQYQRSLPQKSPDTVKLESLKGQLADWKRRGFSKTAIDGLSQQVAQIEGAQVAEATKAKFIQSESFKNLTEWTASYQQTADPAARHEMQIRLDALADHQDAKRFNLEIGPFIADELKRRDREYMDAHDANLKLQRDAALSQADQIERDMHRELGDMK